MAPSCWALPATDRRAKTTAMRLPTAAPSRHRTPTQILEGCNDKSALPARLTDRLMSLRVRAPFSPEYAQAHGASAQGPRSRRKTASVLLALVALATTSCGNSHGPQGAVIVQLRLVVSTAPGSCPVSVGSSEPSKVLTVRDPYSQHCDRLGPAGVKSQRVVYELSVPDGLAST